MPPPLNPSPPPDMTPIADKAGAASNLKTSRCRPGRGLRIRQRKCMEIRKQLAGGSGWVKQRGSGARPLYCARWPTWAANRPLRQARANRRRTILLPRSMRRVPRDHDLGSCGNAKRGGRFSGSGAGLGRSAGGCERRRSACLPGSGLGGGGGDARRPSGGIERLSGRAAHAGRFADFSRNGGSIGQFQAWGRALSRACIKARIRRQDGRRGRVNRRASNPARRLARPF